MKRFAVAALSVALMTPMALAAQPGPRRGAQGNADRIDIASAIVANRQALELTDDQVSRLETLSRESQQRRTALAEELGTLRGQTDLTDEQRTRMREAARDATQLMRENHQGIRSILTVEQSARLQRLAAAFGSFGGGRGAAFGARRGDARFQGQGWQGRNPRSGPAGRGFRDGTRPGRGPIG